MKKAIGVDIGGTNLRVALVTEDGEVLDRLNAPSSGDVKATLRDSIGKLMDDHVEGIGIGVAGLIERASRRVIVSPNLSSMDGQGFDDLGFDKPVFVENDANAAALGEKWMGSGREFNNFVLLTLGTGIGGGIIHNGQLLDVVAEPGHMSIDLSGQRCLCGNHGCLEQYASARAITAAAAKALEGGAESALSECCNGNIYKCTSEDIFRAAIDGDSLAREVLKDAGRYLGVGIANLINLLGPEAVILSGGLTGAWDIYVAEALREVSRRAFESLVTAVKILPASLGGDAGVIGAAALVFNGQGLAR